MPELISPILEPTRISVASNLIQEAHDFIVVAAGSWIQAVAQGWQSSSQEIEAWGRKLKRRRVSFPEEKRPRLLGKGSEAFGEILNQAATVERLLHALVWAEERFPDHDVIECHPTTSAGKKAKGHDLVLLSGTGSKLLFEVSDVAGKGDGNRKEPKELLSLKVMWRDKAAKRWRSANPWPADRCFLVVSESFGSRILKKRMSIYPVRYEDCLCGQSDTMILEVIPR